MAVYDQPTKSTIDVTDVDVFFSITVSTPFMEMVPVFGTSDSAPPIDGGSTPPGDFGSDFGGDFSGGGA